MNLTKIMLLNLNLTYIRYFIFQVVKSLVLYKPEYLRFCMSILLTSYTTRYAIES